MKSMKKQIFILFFTIFSMSLLAQSDCVKLEKIWDNGKHNAFTSLIKFKDAYYCSFREGDSHVFDTLGNAEGKVRIIKSDDGINWKSVGLLNKDGYDLRDPKLSITSDNKLMVIIGGSIYKDKILIGRVPQVSFSDDGDSFSDPIPVKIDENAKNGMDWIWRVTWNDNIGYAPMYSLTDTREAYLSLMSTKDGVNFDLIKKFNIPDFPNEATIRFDSKNEMNMMVRRETGNQKGFWGKSCFPFTEWKWSEMDMRLGGPDFIHLNDSLIVMGTRSHYTSFPKTVLLTGNGTEKFQEIYVFPSGGDTSYPGFIVVGDELWVSYYSSHEAKNASIYLAKVPLTIFKSK